jgi:Kef-type K+ transport system membrane component KefB
MEQATSLILIAAAVFLLPLLSGHLRIPAVVLEILFGILAGPSVLDWIQGSQILDLLAELGLFLLMFLAGFEIDFRKLNQSGLSEIGTSLAIFVLMLGVSRLVTLRLDYGIFMTIVLATASVGIVVPTLRNTRRAGTALGQRILVTAVLAEFLTLVIVAFLAAAQEQGAGLDLLRIPALFLAIIIVLRGLRLAVWWYPERFRRLFSGDDPEELGIRACLALMLAFVGLSLALDVEPILGAFLAGTIFAVVFRNRGFLEHQLNGFSYGFLIPIFFINIGIRFELYYLLDPNVILRALALLGGAMLVKIIPSFILMLRGNTLREALAAGILLAAAPSLFIAVTTVGVELGFLSSEDRAIVVVLAAVTATLAPTAFRWLAPLLAQTNQHTHAPAAAPVARRPTEVS